MGTNYYVELENVCTCCGRGGERLHIGKSSAGWCFGLHVDPERNIRSLEDWKKVWAGKQIISEYNEPITEEKMLSIILDRKWKGKSDTPFGYRSWENFHQANHSVPGPNNLVRSRIDGIHCVGHGDGTYDLILGGFS